MEIFDYSLYGEVNNSGTLKELGPQEALENAFLMWIVSYRGEIIRKPTRGGYVIQWLCKPMNDDTAELIRQSIEDGLAEDFYPTINIVSLTVVPDYDNRCWTITLKGYCPAIRSQVNFIEKLKHRKI